MTKRMVTRADGNKKIQHAFLLGASALAIGVSLATARPARADTIVSTSGSSQIKVSITSTLVSIASGVVRSGSTVLSISAPVGTLINSGTINAGYSGINNQSLMGTLINNATILAGVLAVSNNNTSTITNFINTGTLSSSNTTNNTAAAIYNGGKIGTLTNTGLIRGAENVLFIHTIDGGPGSIGLIANSGTLAGNIWNRTSNNLTIAGGSGSVVGTLTGYTVGNLGTIINNLSNLVLSTGNILLNDRVTITGHTLSNLGAAVTLNTLVSVTGNYNQSAGTLVLQGNGKLAVSNSATVAGTVLTSLSASNNYLATGSVTTLVAGGTGSNYSSVVVSTTGLAPTLVSASGAVSGNNLILSIGNDYVGGTLASIGNTGTLAPSGSISAVYVGGSLGTLTNAAAGTVSGFYGVRVATGGTLGQVVNSGLISGVAGGAGGIYASIGASIGTITNSATGTITSANSFAAINAPGGVIGTITNAGLISNSSTGVGLWDTGTVTQFNNSGTVRNQSTNYGAVYVGASSAQAVGTLNTLSNSGLIQNASASSSGTVAAILADGTVISGSTLSGTIGTVLNSGTISARTAIRVGAYGSIGTVVNSGTVLGNIFNQSTRDLTLAGGSGTTVGTFTGLTGTVGAIISNGNVVFGAGTTRSNILLNDIVYTGGTVYNNSANISFSTQSVATISGAFAQTSTLGTLSLGTARLSITGVASIAGTVLGSFDTAVNHTPGEGITLITADGGISLAYGTLTGVVRASGTGINAASSISGNSLLAQVQNYYVATTYGTITNTGTLTSTSAVYVAATGTLGAVSNTGVIQGNIVNLSTNDLTLLGGSAGTFGTFTGLTGTLPGSIFNTASNVTLAGSILLDDTVNVGGTTHTVVADGATVRLNHGINITGNYSQTGGTLAELSAISGGELIVSGAAVVSGVNYTVVGATGAYHYLQGPAGATPIIAGGAGSSYTSITYDSGITGLTLGGYTQGTSLWGTVLNDYVGDSLASISIGSGTVLATPAGVATLIYIAGSGVLGTLSNSGTIQGNIANNGSADLNLRGGSATWGTFAGAGGTLGTITSTGGNVVVSGGQVYLADQVNVGSGLLYNTGGTLGVAPGVTVTGNYLQNNATGTLVLGPNAPLVVTGSAIITDGYVKVGSFDSLTNHVAGETATLVQAGASSTYTLVSSQSVPVVQSNVGGLGVIGTQVGNNLQAVVENDYFGTSTAAFTQAGTIVLGTNSQASAALYVAGTATIGTLTNTGVLNGEANLGNGIFMGSSGTLGASIGTLVNTGTIAGRVGVANYNGVIGTIDNSGQILDSLPNSGIYNGNTITLVNNQAAGTIAGAFGIANSNLLGTILNAGLVAGSVTSGSTTAVGIANYGTLNTLTNSGLIMATAARIADGVLNYGTLGTLTNATGGTIGASGTIVSGTSNIIAGVSNGGTIGTLTNSGLVTVTGRNTVTGFNVVAGIANLSSGTIGVLSNASTITAAGSITDFSGSRLAGLFNAGVIGTLSNSVGGVINGLDNYTGGNITQLTNAGVITSASRSALFNEGTIGNLSNSGTIQGPTALRLGSSGTIGTFTNSGTIAGSILNGASTALTIGGGAGTVVGVLTGVSGSVGGADKGRITSTGADLVFNSGNLLLNDDITATGRTVVNSGASLRLSNSVIVTGNYAQGATGTLVLGSGALLSVTGAATVTAGTVTSSGFNATGNYLAGGSNVTLVQGGAGSSYNTTVVAGGGITGLGLTGSVSGNDLLAVVGNDYVGASLGSIVNSGALSYSGASTGAVYVAGTGSLGTLVNSGTIAGSIAVEVASGGTLGQVINTGTISGNLVNLSTNGLVLSGGTVAGTYTGGTITSTLANVTLASGAMVLGDAVNVGAGTLVNGGASVLLNTVVSVTGNYGQTGGTLNVGANALLVSGAAVITGGTVVSGATFSSTANYLAGSNASTLIQGGAGSSYSGYSVSAGSLTGLAFGGTTSGTNLVLAVNNDYVGTLLPTLDNTGSIGGMQTALFVRSTGSIGTVSNSGTLAGVGAVTGYGASIAGTIGTLTNSGLVSGDGANGGYGLLNRGTIATLINTVGGTFAALAGTVGYGLLNQSILNTVVNYGLMTGHDGGLQNTGTIQLLDNAAGGTIRSNSASAQQGLRNDGTIVTLLNDGLIGNNYGLFQAAGTIQTLVNNGTIAANASGVYMSAAIGTISNSGTITATHKAIVANAALTALLNSGTLSGTQALAIGVNGRVGTISNSGVIQGNIVNTGTVALSIGGGTGTVVGTLTGSTLTNRGTITSTGTNVVLSGNLWLNDNINVGTNTVTNAGGAITLGTVATITGNYTQASGTLVITPGTSQLSITGRASMTGGTVLASLAGTGNYLAGNSATLGSALSISSFAGVTVVAAGAAGLSATAGLGTVGTLVNLLLAYNNDYVGGTLATLTNTGSLSAGTAVVIAGTGSLGTLSNTGTIAGAVNNLSSHDLTIAGGAGGTVGTFTGQSGKGLITNTLSNVVLASGSLVLNDDVNVGAGTLVNSGASVALNTLLNVTGNYGQSAGRLDLGYGNRLSVTGAAVLTGGTVATTLQSNVNYLAGQAGGTLVAGGAGSSYIGVSVQSGLFPLVLNGTTAGNNLLAVSVNDYIGTILPTLANTGTINTAPTALFVAYGTGSLGTLVNSGTLAGNGGSTAAGVRVVGTLGSLTNSGLISAQGSVSGYALYNQGTIGTVINQAGGTIQAGGTLGGGVLNSGGTILSLVNAGLIMGPQPGLYNLSNGTIVSLNNSGTIRTTNTNAASGIANAGLINTLTNSGLIASYSAIYLNNGTIGSLVNSGTISGQGNALLLTGVGRIGTLVNSGLIRGNIQNYSGNDLNIAGGTGGLVGTFTGAGGTVGTITNTSANVVFSSGALSLNDQINVGANTVRNTGASLALAGNISITGNYSQNAGTLMVNPGTAQLTVSGTASITGGAVQVSLSGTSNYLAGNAYTLVQGGAGSSYTGVTIATAGLTGLGATSSIATVGGNLDLLMAVTTDYVGTVLGSINNTGTLSGATALYIASTGSLGALANSGVIQGDIVNASANALTITGGAGGTVGTFTGQSGKGLITNTLSNVVLASGGLLLNDDVNVGAGTLVNSGASVVLNTLLNVTGNYGQSAGALMMAYGNRLSVTGAAVLTGGTIAVTGVPGTLNMLAGVGGTVVLVTGGVGSGYTGLSYSSDVTGMEVTGSVGGNSLYLAGLNDYIGTVLGSLNNTGTISANNAVYVSATGTLGSLTNTGTLLGANAALNNLGSIGTITIGTLTGTGTTTSYGTVGLLQGAVGITNAGSIGTLVSYATIVGTTGAAVDNQGSMYSLGNAGTITGVTAGITNAGSIGGLVNANQVTGSIGINNTGTIGFIQNFVFATDSLTTFIGSINGSATGLSNAGVVGTLVNAGAITGSIGLNNSGTVLGLANALFPTGSLTAVVGSITGSATGVRNTGVIGTLLNMGVISGGNYALYNGAGATLGTIANAGIINGNIVNLSATDLVIAGGGGTLTGGSISNTASNVVFAGGTQVVNDALNVGSHTVVNSGASLALGGDLSITGNYSQATGTLALSTNHLFVSGVANVSGGVITASVDAAQNYVVGGSNGAILIQGGAGSSYTGVSLTSGVSGLTIAAGVDTIGSNVDLVVAAANDYIGGTLGSLGNSGTITGVVTAAYIATLGSLGTLANSGLLAGAAFGVNNQGILGLVDNSGTISGVITAVYIAGTGSLGTLANSGVIQGGIVNASTNALTVTGGAGTVVGSLTGTLAGTLSTQGTITSTLANVVLGGGNLFLNDQVTVGSGTLVNSGASLRLGNGIAVLGNFSQSSGTLVEAYGNGALSVSGAAVMTGGTLAITGAPGTLNVLAGQGGFPAAVVGGTGSSYTGLSYDSGVAGLELTGSVGGNNLYVVGVNDYVGAALGTLSNTGTLSANNAVYVAATGSVGILSNSGILTGTNAAIDNQGSIGTLVNTGLAAGGVTALYNAANATLGTIVNSGTIQGNIVNLSAGDLVIAGNGTLAGTLTGGSISNMASNVVFAGGTVGNTQVLGDSIVNVGSHTVVNSGATVSLATTVSITGNYSQASGTLALGSNALMVSGVASIGGGVVSTTLDSVGNYIVGASTGVILVQGGAGSSYTGVDVLSGISGLSLAADTTTLGSNIDLVLAAANDYIGGTLASLNNTGTISGVVTAAYIGTLGSLGTLVNSGVLDGELYGIRNRGTIGLVDNSGTATGRVGLWNQGSIGTVLNTGTLKDAPEVNAAGLNNQGTIGAVINQGGTISSVAYGLYNSGTIASIDNSGVISATDTVSGQGLHNSIAGTIGAISNSGTIAGVTALYNQGSIGTIANSGTIAGSIVNTSANALVFTGGTGTVTGTLTGTGGIGTITSTLANVELASGNLVLNDQVTVGTGTLVNSGANVLLTNAISVTGNYSQSAGTLAMGIGSGTAGELLVSGNAAFTGGTVAVTALSGSNLIAGQSYTIAEVGGSLTTSGLSAAATGFSATLGTGANGAATDLLLTLLSDYVSGTLGTLTNTGTINAATAVLITSAGSLGTLANSGVLIGNVVNASANDLVIVGGSNGAVGSFSGGTIRNSLSNLTLASGAVSLGDAIDVTGHTVANTGASLTLAGDVAVTGNYSQTAGTLAVAGHSLSVSGAAQVTGGVVDAGMTGTANYLVGDSVTLIRGGNGSTYTGATVVSGLTGLDATGAASGSNLLAVAGNDYIGASLAVLNVTGTLANTAGGATALYIASTGTLGALANSGVVSGNITNVSARDLTITGGSGTVVGAFTGGTIRNTGANVVFASGNVSLGDAIDVGGTHTVSNIGAAIALTTDVGVNGTYAQSAGSLNVGGHVLSVSGPALVSGGTVSAGVSGVGNYFVGDSVTMIQGGAGSSYTGAVVTSGLTGLDAKGSVSGGNLLAVAGNDYIGASLATLNVTGTLANTAGGATALYIAGTGTLGNLANSGTISGNVVNTSTHDLTINGGGNGAVGRFSGGTITNTGANVVFASGAVSLGDAINVATHTVSNAGASLSLASNVGITGNFSQSSGTLAAGGHVLTVSGTATVAGGVVNAGVSAVGNYLAGDSVTLIQGGTGSNYAGATVTSGITGLSANAVISGSNLLAAAANDYIGASLDTLNNTGTVASPTALYIASTGTLGTLANSGALAGNITNLSTGDLIINGGSATAPGTLTGFNGAIGTISNTGSNVRFTGGVQLLNDHITVGSHTVFNSGATLLVNSAINITGSYSQSAGTLAIGVTSQSSYGNLAVSGAAAFTGGSVLLLGVGSGAGALQAGTYTIASGNGLSLSGVDFTATGYTVTSDLVTVGSTTQLVVKVAGKATNYTAVGNAQGGAAVGTGAALDQIAALAGNSITTNPQLAAFTQQVLAPLATLTPAAKQVAVAQLSPSQLTPQLTATSVTPTTTAISQHQETVASLMDGSEKGMAAGSNGREGVIWGEVVGAGVLRGTTTEAAGYRASSSGLVLGADWFASDEVMAGLAFSWINSASVGQGVMAGSLTRVGSYQLTAYSVWRPDWADQRLSVEGQVGWGYNHYDQRRVIQFLGARANANYGGEQYLGKVTVGYDLPQQGAFTFTPQYSLRFVRLVNHAYQEHDAGPANLKVDVLGTNAVTQELGLKVDTQWNTGVGLLSPDLRVAWVHDFKDGPIPTTGVLAGVAFASTTGRVNTDGLAVNLGATLQQSETFSLRLEYNGEYRHDYQSHGGVLRASWSF